MQNERGSLAFIVYELFGSFIRTKPLLHLHKKTTTDKQKNITLWFSCDWCYFWDPHIHLIKKAETHWEVTFGRHEGEAKKFCNFLKDGKQEETACVYPKIIKGL